MKSFFEENDIAIGKDRGHISESKEREKKRGFSFDFLLILVKHVEFGARFSNPWWFVGGRYLLSSLLSYIWLSVKPGYSSIFPSSIMHG